MGQWSLCSPCSDMRVDSGLPLPAPFCCLRLFDLLMEVTYDFPLLSGRVDTGVVGGQNVAGPSEDKEVVLES